VLVRDEIVGIVGTRAIIQEPAEDLAANESADARSFGSVKQAAGKVASLN